MTKVTPIRPPEDTGFIIALHIGSFSIRLVFARAGSRRVRRAEAQAAARAEAKRWAEVQRLLQAQMLIDQAKNRAA